ncbi:MAG: ImmA/IrrE family metallo-endopeptidase [Planctomycetes bacterium]|nr:ImmA/IrrE family metallo-endopeptidase [Planctomycetota bacterium]
MKVDFLKKEQIEAATLELIQAYGKKYGEVSLPVPVEEMLECHLGLSLEFGDLKDVTGFEDVLGATWIKNRRVVIDTQLDPTENPDKVGRYRFTLAHEVGHWQLHRIYFEIDPLQRTIFDAATSRPSIVCRSSNKEPMEWQADTFASYLLMPAHLVEAVWREEHGSSVAYQAAGEISALGQRFGTERPTIDIAKRMAARFKTSGQAMQIRLTELRLINAAAPTATIFDTKSAT